MADPLRTTILDLVLERAATVGELAAAVEPAEEYGGPPRRACWCDAKMLKVVRTRRVRAIDERFYGRTARMFYVGAVRPEQARELGNNLAVAAAESAPAHEADDLRAVIRHARIPRERAAEFWERVFELTREFTQLPRSGDTVYGRVIAATQTARRRGAGEGEWVHDMCPVADE